MLNSLQQHRASLALWDAHSARFPIRATIVPALDHEERREILSMKMPHLPSLVGGAFFCACSRNSPSNAKRWGADSGPSVRVRPTSGDILKHIRTDVAFPVGGMTEEKTYSGVNNPCLKAEA